MRIDVSENRIEGFVDLYGDLREISVIAFLKNEATGKWHTGSSMCLPSDIGNATVVIECYNYALQTLNGRMKSDKGTA